MKTLLNTLRQKPEIYSKIRKIYGKTIGFYRLKELYLKKVGLWNGKRRIKLIEDKEANNIISKNIKSKEPFMVCRYGSNEFRNLFQENEFDTLCFNAGFFPNNKKLLKAFRAVYFESSKQIDYLCVWNYKNHFNKKRKWIKNFPNMKCLLQNVLSHKSFWIKSLEGKKVLIIHPFKKTIEMQMKRREELGILPKLKKLEVIPAVQTIAGNPDPRFKDWFEALNWMKKEIDKKDFDIALIGCGAYGLPLAAYIKSIGRQAIHLGGALQLFFGIRGKRWETLTKVRMNKYWIRPLKEDIPKSFKKIEDGCYW
jgi:hypothetical protein